MDVLDQFSVKFATILRPRDRLAAISAGFEESIRYRLRSTTILVRTVIARYMPMKVDGRTDLRCVAVLTRAIQMASRTRKERLTFQELIFVPRSDISVAARLMFAPTKDKLTI